MTFIVIFILVAGVIAAVLLNKKKPIVAEESVKVEEVILTPKPAPAAPTSPAKPKVAKTAAKKQPVKK